MKVAQEIDVDNVTIIINSDNKLEALIPEQSTEFTIQEVPWLNNSNVITTEVYYEINNSKKYFKGVKPIKIIKQFLLNDLNSLSSTVTRKFVKPEEQDSYDYNMKKYIRTIEGDLTLDISELQSYNLSNDEIAELVKEFVDTTKSTIETQNYELINILGDTYFTSGGGYTFGITEPEYRSNIRIEGSAAHLSIYEKLEFLSNLEFQDDSLESFKDFLGKGPKGNYFEKEIETSVTQNDVPVSIQFYGQ